MQRSCQLARCWIGFIPMIKTVSPKPLSAGAGRVRARHETRQRGWEQFDWTEKTSDEGIVALGLLHQEDSDQSLSTGTGGVASYGTLAETLESMVRVLERKNPGLRCSILLVDSDR
ncbi:MAG: hypothetical protein ACI9EF_000975 [Pseudohongiellaceae bacterium]|jgi:hypothetical protein